MVKLKIIWSNRAKNNLKDIFEFFNNRNGNKIYSEKLNNLIKSYISIISENPYIGKPSEIENIRILIINEYEIIYKIDTSLIYIL